VYPAGSLEPPIVRREGRVSGLAPTSQIDPLRKFNINREQSAFMFSIVWLRLAAWDY